MTTETKAPKLSELLGKLTEEEIVACGSESFWTKDGKANCPIATVLVKENIHLLNTSCREIPYDENYSIGLMLAFSEKYNQKKLNTTEDIARKFTANWDNLMRNNFRDYEGKEVKMPKKAKVKLKLGIFRDILNSVKLAEEGVL